MTQAGLSTPTATSSALFSSTVGEPSPAALLCRPRLLVLEPCAGRGELLRTFAAARARACPAGETVALACEQDAARLRELRAQRMANLEVYLVGHDWLSALRSGRHTESGLAAWRGAPLAMRRNLVRRGWSLPCRALDQAFDLVLLHPPWVAGRQREEVWPQHLRVALQLVSPTGAVAAVLPTTWWMHPDARAWVDLAARGFRLPLNTAPLGEHELVWLIGQQEIP